MVRKGLTPEAEALWLAGIGPRLVGAGGTLVAGRTWLRAQQWHLRLYRGDMLLGLLTGGPSGLHCVVAAEFHSRWFSRKLAQEFLLWYFARYSVLEARTWTPDAERLLLFLGARLKDGRYMMERKDVATALAA